jgi:uncharacterized cupredoxin-like copper-binding protein
MRSAVLFVVAAALLACPPPVAGGGADAQASAERAQSRKKPRVSPEWPYGREGDPRKVKRTIKIHMSDAMRFFPSEVRVKRGDTVRFAFSNSGQLAHEVVIGTMDDLKKRAALIRQNGERQIGDASAAHVAPGATARIVWQFTKPGEFYYACLMPGHFDAGLIGTIVVR